MATNKDRSGRGDAAGTDTATEPPEMTVNEAAELYPGQWILMRVTGSNEYQDPWRGHILAASHDRNEITEALGREPRPSSLPPNVPKPRHYVFQGYRHIYEPEERRAFLADICGRSAADGQAAEG